MPRAVVASSSLSAPKRRVTRVRKASSAPVRAPERKAPTRSTPPGAPLAPFYGRTRSLVIMGVSFLVSIGVSAALGFSDPGRIDVDIKNEEHHTRANETRATGDPTANTQTIPVQNTSAPPIPPSALMRGRGVGTGPYTPPPNAAFESGNEDRMNDDGGLRDEVDDDTPTEEPVSEEAAASTGGAAADGEP